MSLSADDFKAEGGVICADSKFSFELSSLGAEVSYRGSPSSLLGSCIGEMHVHVLLAVYGSKFCNPLAVLSKQCGLSNYGRGCIFSSMSMSPSRWSRRVVIETFVALGTFFHTLFSATDSHGFSQVIRSLDSASVWG